MIIDTNVYSAADMGSPIAITSMKSASTIELPVVVIGELVSGFMGGNKHSKNQKQLDKFLAEEGVKVLDITSLTAMHYANLTVIARKNGRALANNDIWIAALALEHDLPLATFDKDFVVFEEYFGDKLILLG